MLGLYDARVPMGRPCDGPWPRSGSSRPSASVPVDSGVPAVLIGAGWSPDGGRLLDALRSFRPSRSARLLNGNVRELLVILACMPAPLVEFPADDAERTLRFWHGVLGSPSRHGPPRPDRGGRPSPTSCTSASTSVDRVPTTPLPFRTSPSPTCPQRSSVSASLAAPSSTPAIGGPSAGTPRAVRSPWPPRTHHRVGVGTSAARANKDGSGQAPSCRALRFDWVS
jgi:hypothetical protein